MVSLVFCRLFHSTINDNTALASSSSSSSSSRHKQFSESTLDILLCLRVCSELFEQPSQHCSWNTCQQLHHQQQSMSPTSSNGKRTMTSHHHHNTKTPSASALAARDVMTRRNIRRMLLQRQSSRGVVRRQKRWTYIDPLRVCIAQKCEGLTEVVYYQCVYKKCIPK